MDNIYIHTVFCIHPKGIRIIKHLAGTYERETKKLYQDIKCFMRGSRSTAKLQIEFLVITKLPFIEK